MAFHLQSCLFLNPPTISVWRHIYKSICLRTATLTLGWYTLLQKHIFKFWGQKLSCFAAGLPDLWASCGFGRIFFGVPMANFIMLLISLPVAQKLMVILSWVNGLSWLMSHSGGYFNGVFHSHSPISTLEKTWGNQRTTVRSVLSAQELGKLASAPRTWEEKSKGGGYLIAHQHLITMLGLWTQ